MTRGRAGGRVAIVAGALAVCCLASPGAGMAEPSTSIGPQLGARAAARAVSHAAPGAVALGTLTRTQREAAVDAYWGKGPPAAEQLRRFDEFWQYADRHYAAYQGIDADWPALRDRYRAQVARGVSRGRFAAIMNRLAFALQDAHSVAFDEPVNFFTTPAPGVPLFVIGGWVLDTSGACLTAEPDGSALVYSAIPHHPLGLEPGDRILGYDGRTWPALYRELLEEEIPFWAPIWGSSPSALEHSLVMSAGANWHLFRTMDIEKAASCAVVHVPTSHMAGDIFSGFCSEQMDVPGVPKPEPFAGDPVSSGIVDGTRIGYVYAWSWLGDARTQFAAAIRDLTRAAHVSGLIVDLRYNEGGFLHAPMDGLGELAGHPSATVAMDRRREDAGHLEMRQAVPPSAFDLDFSYGPDGTSRTRVTGEYTGPVAVLLGPGASSAGDLSAIWAADLPRVRTFGESTAMAVGLPTQPALGTSLDLGPDWFARVAETNTHPVGAPNAYLTHRELPVDEPVWLRPDDVAAGRDTVVDAALRWLRRQGVTERAFYGYGGASPQPQRETGAVRRSPLPAGRCPSRAACPARCTPRARSGTREPRGGRRRQRQG